LMCSDSAECISGVCTGGICAAPSCSDGIQNGDETNVDCGGSCGGCGDGEACSGGNECASLVCVGDICQAPSCSDGARNGNETDADCGGLNACPRCADNRRCDAASDCVTALCPALLGRCGAAPRCHWGLISQEDQLGDATIQALFTANGHSFDANLNNGFAAIHSSSAATLSRYSHIVLHEHDRVLGDVEYGLLTNFLEAGGRLVVTGYDSLGSPTDPNLANLLRCNDPADGPFSSELVVVNGAHPLMSGPAQSFVMGTTLMAGSTDHDTCNPSAESVRLVSVGTSSKLNIAEAIGGGGGIAVYWNANGTGSSALVEWTGVGGTQPDLQNLFVNTLEYLCDAP
ncbi:MAG: hypothetical protein ACI9KE_004387, partial [Polyangiales bacterium]